jgi:hypothetical protein
MTKNNKQIPKKTGYLRNRQLARLLKIALSKNVFYRRRQQAKARSLILEIPFMSNKD